MPFFVEIFVETKGSSKSQVRISQKQIENSHYRRIAVDYEDAFLPICHWKMPIWGFLNESSPSVEAFTLFRKCEHEKELLLKVNAYEITGHGIIRNSVVSGEGKKKCCKLAFVPVSIRASEPGFVPIRGPAADFICTNLSLSLRSGFYLHLLGGGLAQYHQFKENIHASILERQ